MLSYVRDIQRQEIRIQLDCVKHQDMVSCSSWNVSKLWGLAICVETLWKWKPLHFQAGTYIGDEHKQYFSGDAALKAGGKDNTMNQFEVKVEKDMLERQI